MMSTENFFSETDWMRFAGLMQQCTSNCIKKSCPFSKFKNLDNTQKLFQLSTINESEAYKMLQMLKCNT